MQVTLSELQFFDHGRSCTLWLDPGSELTNLQEKLVQAFPDCTDLSHDPTRNIAKFSAHLSLGQWPSAEAVQRAQQVWSPVSSPLPKPRQAGMHIRKHRQPHPYRFVCLSYPRRSSLCLSRIDFRDTCEEGFHGPPVRGDFLLHRPSRSLGRA